MILIGTAPDSGLTAEVAEPRFFLSGREVEGLSKMT